MRSMLRWDGRRDFTPATQHCCWRQTDRRQQEGMTVLPAVVCVCMEIYKYMYVCIDTIVQHTQENCRGTILQLPPTDVKLEMNDLQNELEQWHTGTSAHTRTHTHTHTHTQHTYHCLTKHHHIFLPEEYKIPLKGWKAGCSQCFMKSAGGLRASSSLTLTATCAIITMWNSHRLTKGQTAREQCVLFFSGPFHLW